jgi:hypothetical protein
MAQLAQMEIRLLTILTVDFGVQTSLFFAHLHNAQTSGARKRTHS